MGNSPSEAFKQIGEELLNQEPSHIIQHARIIDVSLVESRNALFPDFSIDPVSPERRAEWERKAVLSWREDHEEKN